MTDDAFLRGIAETPDDAALRLVYADWLDDHGQEGRAELVRACERMREVPVFSDEYWRLKARRNVLRPACPAEWLAATGYDGSRYDPLWHDGWPDGWRERWRFIRELTERWHGIPMGDVGGRGEEIRGEEARLGMALSPSLREYVAYAHDVCRRVAGALMIHGCPYSMRRIEGQSELSVMWIHDHLGQFAIRDDELHLEDPPTHPFWEAGEEPNRYIPIDDPEPEPETLAGLVLRMAINAITGGGQIEVDVPPHEAAGVIGTLAANLRSAWQPHQLLSWEGDGFFVSLHEAEDAGWHRLVVKARQRVAPLRLPDFLRSYADAADIRLGVFDAGENALPF